MDRFGAAVATAFLLSFALLLLLLPDYLNGSLTEQQLRLKSVEPPLHWADADGDGCGKLRAALAHAALSKIRESLEPQSDDEVAIYRAILNARNSNEHPTLNVSAVTSPLNIESTNCECVSGIEPESFVVASYSSHRVTAAVLVSKEMRLVDPAAQLRRIRNTERDVRRRGATVEESVERMFRKVCSLF